MPRKVRFGDKNAMEKSIYDIPKFAMSQTGEKALVTIIGNPIVARVHYLRGQEGANFGGYYECLSMDSVSESCPACEYAEEGNDAVVTPSRQRALVQIGQYNTNSQGAAHQPINLEYKVWNMTARQFLKLSDDMATCDLDDITGRDVKVECKVASFRNYDITLLGGVTPAWQRGGETGQQAYEGICAMVREDLDPLLCRTVSYDTLLDAVKKARGIDDSDDNMVDEEEYDSDYLASLLGKTG